MRIDYDDAFLGAEATVVFPVAPGSADPHDGTQHDWGEDDPADEEATPREELTLGDAIRTLLQLRHD
jgi:hypothetical protein